MPTNVGAWPAANEYMQALQNPQLCFADATLRQGKAALDRLGLPIVMSGNFAYVFKLHVDAGARAIKCFRQFLGDREARYEKVDAHLDSHRIPALAEFEYDPEGVTIGGKRYPVLIMEWVEGNTLDVYVNSLIGQGKAQGHLGPLAEQWSALVQKLEAADVAHGDLQHGNVIVTPSGSLRLVDLDGMYVPALCGRHTSELGHIHFQHPHRAQAPFDSKLDHFSSLVIYTSLLALDHDPSLWDRFHDDNLILTKGDFAAPQRSALIQLMKRQGGEVARLTDVIATACGAASPTSTPALSSLVHIRESKLPDWMRPSTVVTVRTKTRDASAGLPAPPTSASGQSTLKGTTPARAGVSTTHTPVAASVPPNLAASQEWFWAGIKRGLLTAVAYWWTGLLSSSILLAAAQALGATPSNSWLVALMLYLACFSVLGVVLEARGRRAPFRTTASAGAATSAPVTTRRVLIPASISRPTVVIGPTTTTWPKTAANPVPKPPPVASTPTTAGLRVIGSSIRLIYHRPGCSWAAKISGRNRVEFASAQMAAARNYRSCKVCNP